MYRDDAECAPIHQHARDAGHGGVSATWRRDLLQRMNDAAWRFLEPRLRRLMDAADDRLFEMAARAGDARDQRHFFEAMRVVRLKRGEFESRWRSLWSTVAVGQAGLLLRQPEACSSLSMLSRDVHEEEIALQSVRVRAESVFQRQRAELGSRLASLFQSGESIVNPTEPAVLCELCRQACSVFNVAIEARLVLYKLFEQQLVCDLGRLYGACSEYLESAGIARAPAVAGEHDKHSGAAGRTLCDEADGRAPAPYQRLIRLLQGRNPSQSAPVSSASAVLPRDELLSLLGELQADLRADNSTTALRELVLSSRRAGGRVPAQSEEDTLTLVSMLFDVILDDQRLAAPMRLLIGRMRIPILRLALQEGNLFTDREHPVRALLNAVFDAAVGWLPAEDLSQDALYRRVEALSTNLLQATTVNRELFVDLHKEFTRAIAREQRDAEMAQKHLEEVERARSKTRHARHVTQTWLNARLRRQHLDTAVEQLVRQGLQRCLFLACLRSGQRSDAWNGACRLIDETLDWARGSASVPDSASLEGRIREALDNTGMEREEVARMLHALHAGERPKLARLGAVEVPAALRGEEQAALDSRPDDSSGGLAVQSRAALSEACDTDSDGDLELYRQRAASLTRGVWMEIREEGTVQRCRLALVLDGTVCLFVDRSGRRVLECSREDLARRMQIGRCQVLDDKELFDSALESVIGNLRAKTRAA